MMGRTNRPRNVHVSVVAGNDGLRVWGASFTLAGVLPKTADGRTDEARAKKLAKAIASVLATVDFEEALALDEAPTPAPQAPKPAPGSYEVKDFERTITDPEYWRVD